MAREQKIDKSYKTKGRIDHVSSQKAYLITETEAVDPLILGRDLHGAQHNDWVEVLLTPKQKGRTQGRVVRILKRGYTEVVGNVHKEEGGYSIYPDARKLYASIKLTGEVAATEGDKVVVQMVAYPTTHTLAQGKVIKNLGQAGKHQAETAGIKLQYGLESEFSKAIGAQVAALPEKLNSEEIAQRRDFRSITTFTIDPKKAQDFDDALSIRTLPNGHHEIGIHIADVTHYVKEGDPIDEEARQRATSVYLVGEVVPMLPTRLSNELCSLVPHQDRPAFSIVVEIDNAGQVYTQWIGETMIHSDHRFTYESAYHTLQDKGANYHKEIDLLHQIAQNLRKKRIAKGAIAFESNDIEIHLDEAGEPIQISSKTSGPTHQLIEEFMLLANRLVATWYTNKKKGAQKPFLYRVHEKPAIDKLQQLASFLKIMGYTFNPNAEQLPQKINQLLQEIETHPNRSIIQSQTIRTMAQAKYTTTPQPHFGLGFTYYTHFTSPIRRYPDLIIHRLLKSAIYQRAINPTQDYHQIAVRSSQQERVAVEAERSSINYKQTLFMKGKEGQLFQGRIVGMTDWALFILLDEPQCEGMVRLADIPGDYYYFDPKRFAIQGKRKGGIYQLGDSCEVLIKQCDIEKQTITLTLLNSATPHKQKSKKSIKRRK